ncbi:hypothetical protein ACFLQT_00095 [Bacteroidota bacterium]
MKERRSNKPLLTFIFFFVMCTGINAQFTKVDSLQMRIDSLEARIEQIYIEQVDNNPYATGEILNWGNGTYIAIHLGPYWYSSAEIGYNYIIKGQLPPGSDEPFLNNTRAFRLGFGLGLFNFDEPVYDEIDSLTLQTNANGVYAKILIGSPVLLNFMSFTAELKILHISPDVDVFDTDNSRLGLGIASDIEFWFYENTCITVGFSFEGDWEALTNKSERSILPIKYRTRFGVRIFL